MGFISSNPLVVGFVVLLLGFIMFMYLFVRRTVLGFREGIEDGSK